MIIQDVREVKSGKSASTQFQVVTGSSAVDNVKLSGSHKCRAMKIRVKMRLYFMETGSCKLPKDWICIARMGVPDQVQV